MPTVCPIRMTSAIFAACAETVTANSREQGERRAFCVIFCIFHLRYYYAARSMNNNAVNLFYSAGHFGGTEISGRGKVFRERKTAVSL